MYGNNVNAGNGGTNNSNAGSNNNSKFVSFLNVKDCVTSKGNGYIGCTTICWVKAPKTGTTQNGKNFVRAQVVLNGCSKTLQYALGNEVPVLQDGGVWVSLVLWDNGHDEVGRFLKRFEGFERRNMVITGSLRLTSYKPKDGSPDRKSVEITVDGFRCVDGYKSSSNAGSAAQPNVQNAPAPAGYIAPGGDFVPLDDEDPEDVPF